MALTFRTLKYSQISNVINLLQTQKLFCYCLKTVRDSPKDYSKVTKNIKINLSQILSCIIGVCPQHT